MILIQRGEQDIYTLKSHLYTHAKGGHLAGKIKKMKKFKISKKITSNGVT